MDATYKASSRSSPIHRFSRAADESDENQFMSYSQNLNHDSNPLTSPLQFQKRPQTKNFMSPTISASSKASRKKKVLAERNQEFSTFCDTLQGLHNHTSNVDKRSAFVMRVSESDDEGQNSSSIPYDPFTNYLSPRPKFLRYKPNRRRQILMSQENELNKEEHGDFDPHKASEETDSSLDAQCHAPSSPPHEATEEANKTNLDDDVEETEEEEEFEEESCFTLRGVMKLVLLLGVMLFSVSYICSMNSPTPSPAMQALWDLRDEYQNVHSQLFQGGLGFLGKLEGFVRAGSDDGYVEEVNVGENEMADELKEEVEVGIEGNKVYGQESDVSEPVEGNTTVDDVPIGSLVEVEAKENHGSIQDYEALPVSSDDHSMEITEAGLGGLKGAEASETAEKSEPLEDFQVLSVLENKVIGQEDGYETAIRREEDGAETETRVEAEKPGKEVVSEAGSVGKEVVSEAGSVEEPEKEVVAEAGSIEEAEKEAAEIEMGIENEKVAATSISIGVCIVVGAIIISSIWVFRKKPVPFTDKQSLNPEKPQVEEEISVAAMEQPLPRLVVEEARSEKLESFIHHSSSIQSMEITEAEVSTDFYESRLAPTVKLLGELDLGEVGSSLRSSNSSRNSSTMVGIEMKSNFAFQEKVQSKANDTVASIQTVQPSESESASPSSYGSFTAVKKIVKKEEGKVATTPVRRSGRIRNRSVMSP